MFIDINKLILYNLNMTETTNIQPPETIRRSSHSAQYIVIFLFLIIGLIGGYVLSTISPTQKLGNTTELPRTEIKELTLPADAVRIQACSDHRGTLYIRPQDIPIGPIYMVHDGKVIGIEFMLNQNEFLSGKSYKYLSALNITIDHVNTGLLSQGHAGYPLPHYHIDLYTVSREIEDTILCTNTSSNMGTMDMGNSILATPSASVSPAR